MRLAAAVSVLALLTAAPALAQSPDRQAINGIIDQGLNHSEVMQTAGYLTDRIGGRMTNSPQMRQAEQWTQDKFRGVTIRTLERSIHQPRPKSKPSF